ncbi:LOW QUALITY PROTEIN: Hypothetical protein PHPALM_5920 [Phytophthora palmivora]|uniref:Tyr recombinase domain-containing protein n=1 Tax=Phytophthora palmivora TaxID=4796 RepID=A0A2P4YG91_9STRA|nr:LOW QUALITY PROTEIN: Hypothetical protein PHPALM_5920 [Phytophthora palmivora]
MGYNLWLPRNALDSNAEQLGAFAVFLWRYGMNKVGKGNTYSTICNKLCAVRWFHKHTAGYDPGVNAGHAILLRGIRRFTNPVIKQQLVTPALLRRIYRVVDLRNPRVQLLWGGLLLAYFFLLRRSKYLFIGNKHHQYDLRLSDISFQDKSGKRVQPSCADMVGIRKLGSKNNQFGQAFSPSIGDDVLCPVKAARWILKASTAYNTQPDQPALSTSLGKRIAAEEVAAILERAATASGLDANLYSTHSIRSSGADRLVIKLMGSWLSNAFEGYPMLTAADSSDLAKMMCGKQG